MYSRRDTNADLLFSVDLLFSSLAGAVCWLLADRGTLPLLPPAAVAFGVLHVSVFIVFGTFFRVWSASQAGHKERPDLVIVARSASAQMNARGLGAGQRVDVCVGGMLYTYIYIYVFGGEGRDVLEAAQGKVARVFAVVGIALAAATVLTVPIALTLFALFAYRLGTLGCMVSQHAGKKGRGLESNASESYIGASERSQSQRRYLKTSYEKRLFIIIE
jgi:hypothetical protein